METTPRGIWTKILKSEEFPMSPEIIAREQKKDTHLKEVMNKSEKFSERTV
jgi:hypothetical protein